MAELAEATVTKVAATIILCLLLPACGHPAEAPSVQASTTVLGPDYPHLPRVKDPDFTSKGERIYTSEDLSDYPLKKYAAFPREIAVLMQHNEIEDEWCRGASGDYPETWRACDRRDKLTDLLIAKGWCWGTSDPHAVSAELYWLKCADAKVR